jgi:hypothetical protein
VDPSMAEEREEEYSFLSAIRFLCSLLSSHWSRQRAEMCVWIWNTEGHPDRRTMWGFPHLFTHYQKSPKLSLNFSHIPPPRPLNYQFSPTYSRLFPYSLISSLILVLIVTVLYFQILTYLVPLILSVTPAVAGFEVLTSVEVITPCSSERYLSWLIHRPWRLRQCVPTKRRAFPKVHGVIIQKSALTLLQSFTPS